MGKYIQIIRKKIWAILLILFPIFGVFLVFLPANYFDSGSSVCLSVQLLGKECYACGMTRGIMHLVHLNFAEAAQYNILSFIVLPLVIVMYLLEVKKMWFDKRIKN